MVLAKSKNAVGLGNSLMNDRFGKGKNTNMHRGAIQRTGVTGERYVTNEKKEASWVKMRSVTEQAALDEFLSTAELAGTDFTAEKLSNVKIIHADQKNPWLLSAAEERATVKKHKANKSRLTVPRRPHWDEHTTPRELDDRERASLLDWRRGLAELQENDDLLLTPFERNIEVWRQLWRVIERSDLVVQIVDARNPLMFRSEDLEKYVKESDAKKNNLLLVNKADMMTLGQRQLWAKYFKQEGINFKFFSAELAKERNEARLVAAERAEEQRQNMLERQRYERRQVEKAADEEDGEENEDYEHDEEEDQQEDDVEPITSPQSHEFPSRSNEGQTVEDPKEDDDDSTRILTTDELEELFLAHAPKINTNEGDAPRKTQIGLVGYPNVGKSSTINALVGAKKVSVSATPGKTKHFQTIHLSDQVMLCDCPGLVFPNFATTKAELVCNGVLPIDQLREFSAPAALVAQQIPKRFLEAVYGFKINVRPLEEGGTGVPTGSELLRAYAAARGFATQGQGQPDESRAARYVLKDYVRGKLLYCVPPPLEPVVDPAQFNKGLYDEAHLPEKRRVLLHDDAATESDVMSVAAETDDLSLFDAPQTGKKGASIDKKFFGPGSGHAGHLRMPFSYQYSEQGQKKQLSGRKQRSVMALENNVDPSELRLNSKRHFKGNKRRAKTKLDSVGSGPSGLHDL